MGRKHETCTVLDWQEPADSMRSTPVIANQEIRFRACQAHAGQTLRELLAKGVRPDREELIAWGCQILAILAESHAQGHSHRRISEDTVLVMGDGRVSLTGRGRPRLAGEAPAEHGDLHALGSLLRRLSFASGLKSGGGVMGSNGRDPLLKVLARATFQDPAMRYRNAAEMAEALRQAGRVRPLRPAPAPALFRKPEAAAVQPSRAPVMPFPVAATPPAKEGEAFDRRWLVLLLAATLLLMLAVLATGWLLVGGDAWPAVQDSVRPSLIGALSTLGIV